jgi:hypothetical protein
MDEFLEPSGHHFLTVQEFKKLLFAGMFQATGASWPCRVMLFISRYVV